MALDLRRAVGLRPDEQIAGSDGAVPACEVLGVAREESSERKIETASVESF